MMKKVLPESIALCKYYLIIITIFILSLLIITNETKAQNDDGGKFIPKKAIERGVWFYSGNYAALDNSMINNLLAKNFNTIYFSTVNDGERWDDESKSKNYLKFIDYAHS